MQWDKFKEFTATHLELASSLPEQLAPISGPRSMRDVVEQELEYITVRPWESLDLNVGGSFKANSGFSETSVIYSVYAHIEGNEKPYTRARKSYWSENGSVLDLINDIKGWHPEYWASQTDRPLVFDAVVRRSALIHYQHTVPTLDRKTLSVYLFPEGFNA